ncbi:MAG: SMC-Scp complex subunit ScpB [Phycisphaerae bacterium]|nr:SMC-Scp complex subunit ScpB [Phycisphaerae bacterium]OUX00778.1 MAG: SMC-Scp complex subunit ScpB [Phycisphaeraceae bacterium TMED231]
MSDDHDLKLRVEAVVMTADRPLGERKIASILDLLTDAREADDDSDDDGPVGPGPVASIREAIEALNEDYDAANRSFRIERVAGGLQVLTLPEYAADIARLKGVRQQSRLSQAALETLAIIAYRQPILRADLESIRGVASGEVLRGLMERRLVRIAGRAEEVGRPMLYGTTREFLEVFGLATLDDLPQAKELRPAAPKQKEAAPESDAQVEAEPEPTNPAEASVAEAQPAGTGDDD